MHAWWHMAAQAGRQGFSVCFYGHLHACNYILSAAGCWLSPRLRLRPACMQPDEAQALLHYYFGAMGGDAASRMALGYRHAHGLAVPKSCWSAAAYYTPVAEEVGEGRHAGWAVWHGVPWHGVAHQGAPATARTVASCGAI